MYKDCYTVFHYQFLINFFSDSTIAWQPNNLQQQQQTNVSVSVSSVWGVSTTPSINNNSMVNMQTTGVMGNTASGGGNMTHGMQNIL